MAQKPETKFYKGTVEPQLKTLPYTWFYKTQEVARRGILDVTVCIRGQFVALELKIPPNKLDALQEYVAGKIRHAGGLALEVTPENWHAVFPILLDLATGRRVLMHHPSDEDRPVQLDH